MSLEEEKKQKLSLLFIWPCPFTCRSVPPVGMFLNVRLKRELGSRIVSFQVDETKESLADLRKKLYSFIRCAIKGASTNPLSPFLAMTTGSLLMPLILLEMRNVL